MLKPYNDTVLIEIPASDFVTAESDPENNPAALKGTVVAVPDLQNIHWVGGYGWGFDRSLLDYTVASAIHKAMIGLMGKTVYLEARSDMGTRVQDGKYALVKLSKIIGVER